MRFLSERSVDVVRKLPGSCRKDFKVQLSCMLVKPTLNFCGKLCRAKKISRLRASTQWTLKLGEFCLRWGLVILFKRSFSPLELHSALWYTHLKTLIFPFIYHFSFLFPSFFFLTVPPSFSMNSSLKNILPWSMQNKPLVCSLGWYWCNKPSATKERTERKTEADAERVVVAFSPSTQGEDRPCFVKRFLPAELFSQYHSKRDHWEISERKQRLHTQSSLGHLGVALAQSIHLLPFQ